MAWVPGETLLAITLRCSSCMTLLFGGVGSGPYRFLANVFDPGARAAYGRHAAYVPRPPPATLRRVARSPPVPR